MFLCLCALPTILSRFSVEKSSTKYQSGKSSRKAVLHFKKHRFRSEGDLLALGRRVRNTRLGIPDEKFFAVRHVWWVAGVRNRDPESADDDDPGHGWPASVREQADKPLLKLGVEYAAVGREDDGSYAKVDVGDVEPSKV